MHIAHIVEQKLRSGGTGAHRTHCGAKLTVLVHIAHIVERKLTVLVHIAHIVEQKLTVLVHIAHIVERKLTVLVHIAHIVEQKLRSGVLVHIEHILVHIAHIVDSGGTGAHSTHCGAKLTGKPA